MEEAKTGIWMKRDDERKTVMKYVEKKCGV
jgi:hypothetical protein